ncbi:hypothetical protein [Duganella sp. HH101]|uniref:hypothetical protein n=1 Tax=Duganella sp. HH101 TaxID=1781066 RepID=UPI00087499F8|nr:hypothetical protein [Duganella sp. HH101]OFA01714.1 hypothetical protein DUGA2_40460 [Duganella sp. HH101]
MHSISTKLAALAAVCCIACSAAHAGRPDQRNAVLPPAAAGPVIDTALFNAGADPVVSSATVTQIEVTQGIQDINHSVGIISARRTLVRVFLDVDTPAGYGLISGKLQVSTPNGQVLTLDPISSVSVLSQWNGKLELQRSWADLALTFEVPMANMVPGALSAQVISLRDMFQQGQAVPCTNCAATSRAVNVVAGVPFRLTVIGLQYAEANGTQHTPRQVDYDRIGSWFQRGYPITNLVYNTRVVAATNPWPFDCGQANAQVAQIRALDVNNGADRRTHYFGLVDDGGGFMRGCAAVPGAPTPSAIGSGPTGAADWGWDYDGSYGDWYTGHEVGHTLGRMHVGGICGESGTDPNYPFAGGQIADATHPFVGYDRGQADLALLPRRAAPGRVSPYAATPVSIWNDVMSYCSRQWLSSYTYEAIRTRITAENALPAGPAPGAALQPESGQALKTGSQLFVVARLDKGWSSGAIASISPVTLAEAGASAVAGAPEVVTLDANGAVIGRTPVQVFYLEDSGDEGPRRAGLITAAVPSSAAVKGLRIEVDGKAIAVLQAKTQGPRLKLAAATMSPAAAALKTAAPASVVLRWNGAHPQGQALTYSVLLSGDSGRTWRTYAVGLPKPELRLPADVAVELGAKAQPLRYRIIASDGFNTTQADGTLKH